MKSCILTGFIFILIASISFGNDFRYLRTEDGLPDGEINSIVQDGTGKMWFATWSGLICYDGYQFRVYRPDVGSQTGLPEKKIKKLFIDSQDNLWIATSMNLSRYIRETNSFITYRFIDIGSRGINIFNLSQLDNHLIIHAVEGIFVLPFTEINNPDYVLEKQPVYYSGEVLNHYFYYSASAGNKLVLVHNISNKSMISFVSMARILDKPALVVDTLVELNDMINDIGYQASENSIYIATPHGLVSYSMKKDRFVRNNFFPGSDIRKVYCASNNRIYGTVRYPKLLYVDLHTGLTGQFEPNPNKSGTLLDNEIHSLFEDFSGNLWIGHQGQGISILNLYRKKFYSFRRDISQSVSLNSNTVMCFEGTANEIIVGCRSNGLNIVQKKQTTGGGISYETIPLLSASTGITTDGIWDIAKQSDSLFWIGTELGLYRLQKTRAGWKLTPFKGNPDLRYSIRKIFIDANKNLWVGSHGFGLFFIPNPSQNKEGLSYQFASDNNLTTISDDVILDIFLDSKKRFWVGTNNGLNMLQGDYENLDLSGLASPEVNFKRYVAVKAQDDYLNNNEINCLIENYDGNLWIATQGGGINILNPVTEKFTYITAEEGLPSDDVISMIADEDGYLWVGTNKGLARFNRFETKPSVVVFNSSDGTQGEIFMINSYYKAIDGQLFFGGDKGFTSFYPRDIKMNEIKPKISFTDLRIRNRLIELGDTLHGKTLMTSVLDEMKSLQLPFKNNVLSVGVSALHFQHPSDNRITYTLEGLFRNWITVPASYGYIYLSNIPPGKYLLKAKAISSDGILSENEKQLSIEITPPWYKTRLAIVAYALLALFLSYVLINFLINRQKSAYQKKLDSLAIDNNENKMMFLTNIAHELRTPLSLIIAPVEDIMRNISADSQWKGHLQLISRNSGYLLRLINQIIDFRKLHAGKLTFQPQKADVVKVVKDVVMNFQGYDANRHIRLITDLCDETIIANIDVQKFEEILYNLISNAFKNTFDNHSITVKLKLSKDKSLVDQTVAGNMHLTVFNEGKEIDDENRDRIFMRFYKVNEYSEGSGIGLSFAKSLVEMHNGTISVESIPGKGVAFHVIIPAGDFEMAAPDKLNDLQSIKILQPSSLRLDGPATKDNGHLNILIVEDNQELGDFLVSIFSRKYKCLNARNGDDAWKLVQLHSPSIIISDVLLPGMNGLELCRKIKENKETCHIPVLLLTAKDSQEQIAEGYAIGADSYVTKPFDIELLLSQTARLIQNRELIREKYITQNFMVEVQNSLSSRDEEFLLNVRRILDVNISDPELNVNNLSQQMNLSTTQLYRRVKELTGYSPVEFIRIVKLQKAYGLLNTRSHTVKEVCYLTGFNNMSYFIKCFREQFGITPAHFRDKGQHEKTDELADVIQV